MASHHLQPSSSAADIADRQMNNSVDMANAATQVPAGAPGWFKSLYHQSRDAIQDEWYDTLMLPVADSEIRDICSTCEYYVAPGDDGISAGVWRLLVENSDVVCHTLTIWMSACLRLSMMPALGKRSIIVPIPKKRNQPMNMSNIRPISLQSSLTKLLSKLLATRIATIFSHHPILHPAQEAFIKNGAISNCVDTWLDIWEVSKSQSTNSKASNCFNLFYDIKAAYDSVQHMDLLRSFI
jgi:hypothetical protein